MGHIHARWGKVNCPELQEFSNPFRKANERFKRSRIGEMLIITHLKEMLYQTVEIRLSFVVVI